MRRIFVLFPLYVLLLGCQDLANENSPGQSAATSKKGYTFGEAIVTTISNQTAKTIFLHTCCGPDPGYAVDRFESGTWTEYERNGNPCLRMCIGPPPILVRPYQNYEIRLTPGVDRIGTYRFRFLFSPDEGANAQELASNSFVVN